MVNALVETNVIVDLLRRYSPAVAWLRAESRSILAITPVIWMEVTTGGDNKIERQRAAQFMEQFEMIYLTQDDFNWAMQVQIRYELSHGVGMMDCLIASVSHRLQLPLYTHNLKHFTPLLGDLAQKPY